MMSCEKLLAFALTEPNDGSDVVRFETRARLDWRGLNGAKRWIGLSPNCRPDLDLGAWARTAEAMLAASSSTARG